uniref:Reverse transcriptase domain-containing protein n=1 Tax=Tanacetum cinerariifolium TaxID=118510 RepID=A0A6L2MHE9_TANCI|nr:hypothetical protein [Tanacetum cinerariifolium]
MNNNHNQEPPPQDNNGPPSMVRPNGQAPRTMEELCQPSINGRVTQIDTFYNGLALSHRDTINVAAEGTFMQKIQEECYELIENMTAHHNHWDTLSIQDELSRHISSSSTTESPKTECPAIGGYTQETSYATTGNYNSRGNSYQPQGRGNNFNQAPTYQAPTHQPQTPSDFQAYMKANDAVMKNIQTQMTSLTHSNIELKNMFGLFMKINTASSSGTGSLPSNTVLNPREDLKVITTQSGVTLAGTSAPPPPFKEVDQEPKTITDQVLTESTNNVPLLVVQPSYVSTSSTHISSSKVSEVTKDMVQPSIENIQPLVTQTQVLIDEPIIALKPKPTIPYPSRVNKQKLREKDDNLALKFVEIFRNLHFELSFADALLHMPKFALMLKSLLNNKEKLFDLATTPVNESYSTVILKKLPEKLGDPNKNLSLSELTSTLMILELADRSTTRPAGISEDVFVKVGKFHFLTDFVVVDYVVDPRVLLILRRPFFRTRRALIDVYGEELTLCVNDEAITFKMRIFKRYSILILWFGYMVLTDLPLHRSSSFDQLKVKSYREMMLHFWAMKRHKLFQLAYDVHTCRMIPWLVIILEEDMCTSGTIPTTIPYTTPVITPPTTQTDTRVIPIEKPIITPTIPPSPDYTPASLDYSHASDTESNPLEDPSSGHIPPLPAVSSFLSSDDDITCNAPLRKEDVMS